MLLRIDHLVIAVADPDAAATEAARDLGLAFTGGGRHEHAGTFNRLAFLGDTYLELIGVFDPGLVRSSPAFAVGGAALAMLEAGAEGLATYALATDDAAGDVAGLRAAGAAIGEPVAGTRVRTDGGVVRWLAAFPSLGPGRPPFLIEHDPTDAEWNGEARGSRAIDRQPVGGQVRLASLTIPVTDPEATAATYAATLGLAFDGARETMLGGQAIRLVVGEPGDVPIVDLSSEAGTPPLDLVRFGIRWRRSAP